MTNVETDYITVKGVIVGANRKVIGLWAAAGMHLVQFANPFCDDMKPEGAGCEFVRLDFTMERPGAREAVNDKGIPPYRVLTTDGDKAVNNVLARYGMKLGELYKSAEPS